MTTYRTGGRRPLVRLLGAVTLVVAAAACSEDALVQPNLNSPSEEAIDRDVRQSVQLRATGILALDRDMIGGFVSDIGILGRESYNYTPTETRNTLEYVTSTVLTNAAFSSGGWTPRYRNMRGMRDLIAVATRADNNPLTTAERAAVRGFANTMWALDMWHVIAQRDTLGAVVDIIDKTDSVAAFVRRDSVYRFILGKLQSAATDLAAGGGAFPFAIHTGFSGFTTPATFLQFNRALYARVSVHFASLGGGAANYTNALTALGQSFLDDAASADLRRGIYHVYSTASGDALNGISTQVSPDQLAHPSFTADGVAGDTRLTKVTTFSPARTGPRLSTNIRYNLYPANNSPVPVIRNEELILLRAEARYFTANAAGALADINYIRGRAGLAARGAFTNDADFITELLFNRRYSLAFEGHRWVDVRRFGRLATIPRDNANDVVAPWQPIPVAECDARTNIIRRLGAAANAPYTGLAAPSCPAVAL